MLASLIALVVPPLCLACGAHAGRAAPLCRDCRAEMRPALSSPGVWAAFDYEGPAGALVRALKFGGRVAVADVMAAQLAAALPAERLSGVVVPVPAHTAHRRRRGVDHAAALAQALSRRASLGYAACLVRAGDPQPQVGRGRRARMAGPAGSVALRSGGRAPREVLLVDDVVTTGATLAACAKALTLAGAQRVTRIAYARTTAR